MAWIVLADGAVDTDLAQVRRGGRTLALTAKEAEVLAMLVSAGGRPVARDAIHGRVFGYRPGTRTRAADDTVKRLRKKVEADPSRPVHLLTVRGVGYRFAAAASDADVAPGVVGRAADVRALIRLLDTTGAVALTGLGGIGKSTVARAVAERWQAPAWVVPLGGVGDLADLVAAVAVALGQQVTARSTPAAALALGRSAGGLVVFDEADGCLVPLADLLALWVEAVPGLRTLVVAREPPPLPGLQAYRLGPLALDAAVELLVRRGAVTCN